MGTQSESTVEKANVVPDEHSNARDDSHNDSDSDAPRTDETSADDDELDSWEHEARKVLSCCF